MMLKKIITVGITALLLQPLQAQVKNIIYILSDDHRYDAMAFMGKVKGISTPAMDRMANEGMHLRNAFVSTALCSPSRASILTGQYAHAHTVVDNDAPLPHGLKFFPQYLQQAGYQTAFLGKWHIGHGTDDPQPGFDYWLSFKGQGVYYNPTFNINGKQVAYSDSSYITDLMTDYAVSWLDNRDKKKPFFLYLSHKGVHAEFEPAKKHRGRYADMAVHCPPSMYLTATDSSKHYGIATAATTHVNYAGIPQWVRNQRYSWHGVDYMYHGQIPFDNFYRRYYETLQSVDESIGRIMQWLIDNNLEKETMLVYMGDNGFSFGEHGLIDKRHAYEESMRVPLLAWAPGTIKPKSVLDEVVMNVDLAPTFLDMAGVAKPSQMQGYSFSQLLRNTQAGNWPRKEIYYEYFWESAFPQTPTTFAVRTNRYKYIYYQGVWDTNELFDLEADPYEMNNLIQDSAHRATGLALKQKLFAWLGQTGGMQIPLKKTINNRIDHIYRHGY